MKQKEKTSKHKYDEYYELLVQNAQRGAIYYIKLRNDPKIFHAIPMIDQGFGASGDHQFMMKVLLPESHRGIYLRQVKDIEKINAELWTS